MTTPTAALSDEPLCEQCAERNADPQFAPLEWCEPCARAASEDYLRSFYQGRASHFAAEIGRLRSALATAEAERDRAKRHAELWDVLTLDLHGEYGTDVEILIENVERIVREREANRLVAAAKGEGDE